MQMKHATEYKCFLLHTHTLSTAEKQLNELFEDGWQFHTVFTAGLANGGSAEYAIVYRQEEHMKTIKIDDVKFRDILSKHDYEYG